MVRSLALVALVACSSPVTHPDAPASAWSLGPAMQRRALEPGVATFGQRVVVAGGFDTGAQGGLEITARVDAFDVAERTWVALPDAPVRWTDPNLAAIGVTLYLLGGLEGSQRTARGDAFALDVLSQDWRTLTPMDPADARGAAGVVTAPGRIYLLGGASSTAALASCLEYDIAQGTWSHLPDLPAPRSRPAAMRMSDGTLIVVGGFESLDASQPRQEVWALSPPGAAQRSWRQRDPAPEPRGGCAHGVVLSQLICAGGDGGQAASKIVDSYDPYLDVWTPAEAMPVERTSTQGAAVGGRLFVPGGAGTLAIEPTDTLYIYAPLDTAAR